MWSLLNYLSSACTCLYRLYGGHTGNPIFSHAALRPLFSKMHSLTHNLSTPKIRPPSHAPSMVSTPCKSSAIQRPTSIFVLVIGDFVTDRNLRFEYTLYADIHDVQSCCTLCYHTPECVTFQIDPKTDACTFTLLTASSRETPYDGLCPAGIIEVYDPYQETYDGEYGLDLRAYLQYWNE